MANTKTPRSMVQPAMYVMILDCPDRPGIVHAVSSFVLQYGANIVESQQFGHGLDHRFFMRVQFEVPSGPGDLEGLTRNFGAIADRFTMRWRMVEATAPTRTLVLVSRFGHCLNDLLFRSRSASFPIEIAGIVSNHRDLEALAASDVPTTGERVRPGRIPRRTLDPRRRRTEMVPTC